MASLSSVWIKKWIYPGINIWIHCANVFQFFSIFIENGNLNKETSLGVNNNNINNIPKPKSLQRKRQRINQKNKEIADAQNKYDECLNKGLCPNRYNLEIDTNYLGPIDVEGF